MASPTGTTLRLTFPFKLTRDFQLAVSLDGSHDSEGPNCDISGDGVFGLQRDFKESRANTILMSLWDVNDEATQILMTEFYRNYLSGKSKQESLKLAQQYLRNYTNGEEDYSTPEYWAAFILLDALN